MSVSLSVGMRNAVYSMGDLQSQIDRSNTRLSTGKKVNSAVDDARSYFAAQAFGNEATKLNGLIEGMSQARQTIDKVTKAIDGGIKLLESADSLARQAQMSQSDSDRFALRDQVAELLTQTMRLFADSGFNGKQTLITDSTGMGASSYSRRVGAGVGELGDAVTTTGTTPPPASAEEKSVYAKGVLTVNTSTSTTAATSIVIAPIDVRFSTSAAFGGLGLTRPVAGTTPPPTGTPPSVALGGFAGGTLDNGFILAAPGVNVRVTTGAPAGTTAWDVANNEAQISQFRTDVQNAMNNLRTKSAAIATQAATIDVRMGFTKDTARINSEAADNLVVANINEEGANLSALQTKQQLAVQALSLASRADQAILRLF
jgi:flagellin-like hook-associated protein FlgL